MTTKIIEERRIPSALEAWVEHIVRDDRLDARNLKLENYPASDSDEVVYDGILMSLFDYIGPNYNHARINIHVTDKSIEAAGYSGCDFGFSSKDFVAFAEGYMGKKKPAFFHPILRGRYNEGKRERQRFEGGKIK